MNCAKVVATGRGGNQLFCRRLYGHSGDCTKHSPKRVMQVYSTPFYLKDDPTEQDLDARASAVGLCP